MYKDRWAPLAPMQTDSECGYSTNFSPDHSTPGFLYLFPLNTRLLWVSFTPCLSGSGYGVFHCGFLHSSLPYTVCFSSSRNCGQVLVVQPSDGLTLPLSFLIIELIRQLLAGLGLCCTGISLVEASGGCSLVVVPGLLTAVAPPLAEHQLRSTWASVVADPRSRAQAPWLWRWGLVA